MKKDWHDDPNWKDEFVIKTYMCSDETCLTANGNRRVYRITAEAFENGIPKFKSCPMCGSPVTDTKKKQKEKE